MAKKGKRSRKSQGILRALLVLPFMDIQTSLWGDEGDADSTWLEKMKEKFAKKPTQPITPVESDSSKKPTSDSSDKVRPPEK